MPIVDIHDLPLELLEGPKDDPVERQDAPVASHRCFITLQPEQEGEQPKTVIRYLPLEILPEYIEEIRWYLEYHVQEPFETERASKAKEVLYDHPRKIISEIDLSSFIPENRRDQILILRVRLENSTQAGYVFWELLERKEFWGPTPRQISLYCGPQSLISMNLFA